MSSNNTLKIFISFFVFGVSLMLIQLVNSNKVNALTLEPPPSLAGIPDGSGTDPFLNYRPYLENCDTGSQSPAFVQWPSRGDNFDRVITVPYGTQTINFDYNSAGVVCFSNSAVNETRFRISSVVAYDNSTGAATGSFTGAVGDVNRLVWTTEGIGNVGNYERELTGFTYNNGSPLTSTKVIRIELATQAINYETTGSYNCVPAPLNVGGWNWGSCFSTVLEYYIEIRVDPPPASGTLTCGTITLSSIQLNWSTSNANNARIRRVSPAGTIGSIVANSGSGTETDTGRSRGTSYTYQLRNNSNSGTILASVTCTTLPNNNPSGSISASCAVISGTSRATVTVTHNVSDADNDSLTLVLTKPAGGSPSGGASTTITKTVNSSNYSGDFNTFTINRRSANYTVSATARDGNGSGNISLGTATFNCPIPLPPVPELINNATGVSDCENYTIRLTDIEGQPYNMTLQVRRDLNDDGDLNDPGEGWVNATNSAGNPYGRSNVSTTDPDGDGNYTYQTTFTAVRNWADLSINRFRVAYENADFPVISGNSPVHNTGICRELRCSAFVSTPSVVEVNETFVVQATYTSYKTYDDDGDGVLDDVGSIGVSGTRYEDDIVLSSLGVVTLTNDRARGAIAPTESTFSLNNPGNPLAGIAGATIDRFNLSTTLTRAVINCNEDFVSQRKPYVQAFNSNVVAGYGIEENKVCRNNADGFGSVLSNITTGSGIKGSGTQLAVFATNQIDGFRSAILQSGRNSTPWYEAFANTTPPRNASSNLYGGGFENANLCAADWFANEPDSLESGTEYADIQTSNLSSTYGPNDPRNSIRRYRIRGGGNDYVKIGTNSTNLTGYRTLYFLGDVYIDNNITVSSTGWTSLDDIPFVAIVAYGDIMIAPNVTRIDAILISKGSIYTCAIDPNDPDSTLTNVTITPNPPNVIASVDTASTQSLHIKPEDYPRPSDILGPQNASVRWPELTPADGCDATLYDNPSHPLFYRKGITNYKSFPWSVGIRNSIRAVLLPTGFVDGRLNAGNNLEFSNNCISPYEDGGSAQNPYESNIVSPLDPSIWVDPTDYGDWTNPNIVSPPGFGNSQNVNGTNLESVRVTGKFSAVSIWPFMNGIAPGEKDRTNQFLTMLPLNGYNVIQDELAYNIARDAAPNKAEFDARNVHFEPTANANPSKYCAISNGSGLFRSRFNLSVLQYDEIVAAEAEGFPAKIEIDADDFYVIYVNGRLIYQSTEAISPGRVINVPSSLLRRGQQNVIAIQVIDKFIVETCENAANLSENQAALGFNFFYSRPDDIIIPCQQPLTINGAMIADDSVQLWRTFGSISDSLPAQNFAGASDTTGKAAERVRLDPSYYLAPRFESQRSGFAGNEIKRNYDSFISLPPVL